MSDGKERARGYLEGYQDGMKDAWGEFLSLTTKGYQPREIRILVKSKIMNIQKKVEEKKRAVESRLGESLEEPAPVQVKGDLVPAEIKPGGTYLVEEDSPEKSFAIFKSLIGGESIGLCISRVEPRKILRQHGIEARTIWLTKTEVPDSVRKDLKDLDCTTLSPTGLDMLTTIILEFLSLEGQKVVLLGGMEYLLTHNEFHKLLRLLQNMKDRISYAQAVMIVPYDPQLLDEKDLRRLRSEIEEQL